MSDYFSTALAFVVCAAGLWLGTRKSRNRLVRIQWRKPHWILLRLLLLVAIFHGLFALLGVRSATGFASVVGFGFALVAFDFTGAFAVAVGVVGQLIYEWLFWLASRRQVILRKAGQLVKHDADNIREVEAVALSDLKPCGKISVNGEARNARSELGYIAKGARVVIKQIGAFEVIVRKLDESPENAVPMNVKRP